MKRRRGRIAVAPRHRAEVSRGAGTPSPPARGAGLCSPAPRPPLRGVPALPVVTDPMAESTPMTEQGKRICRLADEAARTDDPESALRILTELRRELDDFMRVHVQRGLAAGRSFGDVARALGISRQAAHRRYRALAPARSRQTRRRRLVATDQVRHVLRLAQAATVATGAAAAGSRHVLLGILQADGDAARALRSEGITLERVRACGQTTDSDGRGSDDPTCVRRILRDAGRVALASGHSHLRPEQLLLAALADPDGGASRTVTALGATPASIRARLGC
jgi:ATP-dependent Clp protease ATP-binding subunit ClpA